MVAMSGMKLSPEAVRGQIASAVGMIIQIMRMSDGKRKMMSVSEIVGMEGDVVTMQDLFVYEYQGENRDGSLFWELYNAMQSASKNLNKLRAGTLLYGRDVAEGE